MIDFQTISSTAIAGFRGLLSSWLPGGSYSGDEYTVRNPMRSDENPGSFKINVRTGAWCDFASGDKGGDPISLYAYINGVNNGKAASMLSRSMGLENTVRTNPGPVNYTEIIWPAGNDTASPPAERNVKTDSGWIKYPISMIWPYRNQLGELLGYVARYETPTGKEVLPLTLWKTDTGAVKWRWKSFPDPRPLFGLDRLAHAPQAQVIVCEGEKKAEALQGLVDAAGNDARAAIIAIAWPGGCKAFNKADFSALRGRRCVLWPDNDAPGRSAMLGIAGILHAIDASVKILNIPKNMPQAWDVADMIQEGATLPEVLEFIRAYRSDPPENLPKPKKTAEPKTENQEQPTPAPAAAEYPFRCLGYNKSHYYYLPAGTRQVAVIKSEAHGKGTLRELAKKTFWERYYQGEKGPRWDDAADDLMRMCERMGIYDTSKMRGRGAWYDDGRSVLHLGDKLLIDGSPVPIGEIQSKFVYEAAPPLEFSNAAALTKTQAHRLREITDILFWERPIYASYLAGWIAIAPICGAMAHRPHIWITGSAGTGKTHVLDSIIKPILGNFSLPVQSETTSAGVRQALDCDALPILLDEFEGEDLAGQERVQKMLELARQAFSDTSARIVKGSQGGKAQYYNIRSCFLMSSIGVNIQKQADITRVMILSLAKPYDTEKLTKQDHFKELCRLTNEIITPEWSSGFRARSIAMVPIIRKNAETFAAAVAEKIGNRRAGDQIGPLLAGAYSLSSDGLITIEKAREYVQAQDWSDHSSVATETDEQKCLDTILQSVIRMPHEELCIAELIEKYKTSLEENAKDKTVPIIENYDDVLKRIGIKYEPDDALLYISDSHIGIRKLLHGTSWEKTWGRLLKRIPGAIPTKNLRITGKQYRATALPINSIFEYYEEV